MNSKNQIIKIRVSSAGETVKVSANTNKLFEEVRGLFVNIADTKHHYKSTIGLRIDEEEIFPDEYESSRLTCVDSAEVNPYYYFDKDEFIEAGGSKVEIKYCDGGMNDGVTFPYDVNLYLYLKNKPKDETK